MNSEKIKKNILEKIKSGEIKKTLRWYFISKKYMFWFFSLFFVILGSFSFSILLKNIFNDFGSWYLLDDWMKVLPLKLFFVWMFGLIIFIILAYFNFKNTKKGFKYRVSFIVFVSLILSIIFGSILYKINFSNYLDQKIEKHSKIYSDLKIKKRKELEGFLEKNNIDKNEFFKNKRVIKLKNKFKKKDRERIERLKNILEKLKDKKGIDLEKIQKALDEIKKQKEKVDEKRFQELLKEFREN